MNIRNLILIIFSLTFYISFAQEEFNAVVIVNSDKIQNTNRKIYKTLENSITDFINQTKWTTKKYLPHERINCAFTITLNEQDNNKFKANIQVQAMRPVYSSSYETPILNINDKDFNFTYVEFQPFNFNETSFDNNLISTLAFYAYTILGVDSDTFALNGGTKHFKKAANIMRLAQQRGGSAWENKMGEQNRYALIDGFTSSKFSTLRKVFYNYHRKGMDLFSNSPNEAKKEIAKNIIALDKLHNITVGNYLIRVFIDTKSDEIVNIFSNGKSCGQEKRVKNTLTKIAATQSYKWRKI